MQGISDISQLPPAFYTACSRSTVALLAEPQIQAKNLNYYLRLTPASEI